MTQRRRIYTDFIPHEMGNMVSEITPIKPNGELGKRGQFQPFPLEKLEELRESILRQINGEHDDSSKLSVQGK